MSENIYVILGGSLLGLIVFLYLAKAIFGLAKIASRLYAIMRIQEQVAIKLGVNKDTVEGIVNEAEMKAGFL